MLCCAAERDSCSLSTSSSAVDGQGHLACVVLESPARCCSTTCTLGHACMVCHGVCVKALNGVCVKALNAIYTTHSTPHSIIGMHWPISRTPTLL